MGLTDIAIKPRVSAFKLSERLGLQLHVWLRSLHTLTGHSPLLFHGEHDHQKSMSNNTLLGAQDRVVCAGRVTGHG